MSAGSREAAEARRLLGVAKAVEDKSVPPTDPLFPVGVALIQTYRTEALTHAVLAVYEAVCDK